MVPLAPPAIDATLVNTVNAIFVMPTRNKSKNIPENTFPPGIKEGIYTARTSFNGLPDVKEVERSHRDNGHIFILQEKGATHMEVDFQIHHTKNHTKGLVLTFISYICIVIGNGRCNLLNDSLCSKNYYLLNHRYLSLCREGSIPVLKELAYSAFSTQDTLKTSYFKVRIDSGLKKIAVHRMTRQTGAILFGDFISYNGHDAFFNVNK